MAEQLHKRFTDEAVKSLLDRYAAKEIKAKHIQQMLNIRERRFLNCSRNTEQTPLISQFNIPGKLLTGG